MTVAHTALPAARTPPGGARARARGGSRFGEHLAAGLVILGATAVLLAPLLSGQTLSAVGARMFLQFPWAGVVADGPDVRAVGYPQTDQADALYPLTAFLTDALRQRELPLWLPWALGGVPLTALAPLGLLYPGRWALMLVLEPGRQHDLVLLAHLLLAGLGMYALLRAWGASAVGGVLGAVVWEFSGYNMGLLVLERAAVAAAWLPLALLAATLALQRRSLPWADGDDAAESSSGADLAPPRRSLPWAVAAGAALGLGALGGGLDLAILSGALVGGWCAVLLLRAVRPAAGGSVPARRGALRTAALAATIAGVALAVTAALWLPLLQARGQLRFAPLVGPLHQPLGGMDLARGLLVPVTSPPAGGFDVATLAFVGYPALLLAVVGLASRRPPAPYAAAAGACALAAAVGGLGLVPGGERVYRAVPPTAALFVVCFALATLAALGLTHWLDGRLGRAPRSVQSLVACGAVAITAWQLLTLGMAVNPVQPAGVAWQLPATPLVGTLRTLQQDTRILPVGAVLGGNAGAALGLRSFAAYLPLVPAPAAALWSALLADAPREPGPAPIGETLSLPLLNALSLGLIATPPGQVPTDEQEQALAGDRFRLIYAGPDGWVYQNVAAPPRAYLATRVRSVPNQAAALEAIADGRLDPGREALIEGPLPVTQAAVLAGVLDSGIAVTPNPVPFGEEPRLSWDVGGETTGEVWVAKDGAPETLVARGPRGAQDVTWIAPNASYEFRLYAGAERASLLGAVSVRSASTLLAVTPNRVPAGQDTQLWWGTPDGAPGEVWVAQDEQPEALVARGATGAQSLSWIGPHSTYAFRLYAGQERGTLLAATTVTGTVARAGRFGAGERVFVPGARIAMTPNPVLADGQEARLAWNTAGGGDGEVWVAQDGGPESLVARAPAGTRPIPWVARDSAYEFRLYAGEERAALLASVTVAPPLPTNVGLTVSDRIVAGRRTVALSWRMPDRAVGQVWATAGGTDMLMAQSAAGTRDLPWISPNVTYQFQLYAGTERSALIDLKTVKLDAVDTRRERAAPGSHAAPPLEPPAAWPTGEAGTAAIVRDRLTEVEVEVEAAQPALLVLNDTWAPGWRAWVNGAEYPILRVNYAARGLVVPAGEHQVVFRYQPLALQAGLGITAAALVLAACVLAGAVGAGLRRRPAAPPRTGA